MVGQQPKLPEKCFSDGESFRHRRDDGNFLGRFQENLHQFLSRKFGRQPSDGEEIGSSKTDKKHQELLQVERNQKLVPFYL
jgi:hypothetical protein